MDDHFVSFDESGLLKDRSGKISQEIRKSPFLYWAWKKVHYHQEDALIAVVGKTGFGKSTLAMRFAEVLDRDATGRTRFNIDKVIYGMKDFQSMLSKEHPIGSAFVLEEPQTFLNSRDSMTRKNINALRLFSTGRVFRNYLFLTYPKFNRIDKQIRELLHAVIDVHRPDREKGISNYTPFLLDSNDSGEIFRWKFRIRKPDAVNPLNYKELRVDEWNDVLPSKALSDAYEKKSLEWKAGVRKGLVGYDGSWITKEEKKSVHSYSQAIDARNIEVDSLADSIRGERHRFKSKGRYVVARISAAIGRSYYIGSMVGERLRLMDELEQ